MAIIVTPYTNSNANYNPKDESLLNSSTTQATFDPSINYIEYTISTPDKSFLVTDYTFSNYKFPDSKVTSNAISNIILEPRVDAESISDYGIDGGEYISKYNFLQNELESSYSNRKFFVKDISADRTEITLGYTDNPVFVVESVNTFKERLNINFVYFQDFFLNFGDDVLCIANNITINSETFDILINLYDPLPNDISVKDTLWIVTQIADPLEFTLNVTPDIIPFNNPSISLKGPNLNIPVLNEINNSTGFETYSSLITSSLLSTSYSQLNNLISASGIQIGVDYTDFSNFVHFSSAVTRINNFYYKVGLIKSYTQEIATLKSIPSLTTSTNISLLTNKINSIIENFDGYEYFLYYDSGSYSWPKSTSTVPYTLYPTSSTQVENWLGSTSSLTGILGSASLYDRNNLDYLYNTVPVFIQDDPQNDPYKVFVEMVAQAYDNIWIYYKDVTNRYNADNRLDFGISKDLVANALKSFGVKLYQNNFSTNDLYSAFLGYGAINPEITGSLPVTAGSGQEYIKNYITASYDASVTPLDDVNKETYKRLYHNLPYLAKTKGTIPGLRALINCFGIPDTILRISEFGGRDKDTSTYDYFDQQYNYAITNVGSIPNLLNPTENRISTSWLLNTKWGATSNRPESIQFRFKTGDISLNSKQMLWSSYYVNPPYNITSSITLTYTGSGYASASYSGSTYSASYQYANLNFIPDVNNVSTSASLYLPFYNNDWWSIMVNKSGDDFTLYAGNKLYYDGYDGNQIGFLKSSSVTSTSNGWKSSGFSYLIGPSASIGGTIYSLFTGSIQELRYWSKTGSVEAFKDFIMNPSSIDYWGKENEYANYLAFRLPLGNELYTGSTSVHPKVTGSWSSTSSFSSDSNSTIGNTLIYTPDIKPFFYNQPIVGIRNRVTDKIQIVSSSYPTGSVLSQYRSLEQTYPSLGSETPDINLLEVAFSPQNEINDDIISSLGYFNIGEYIGDPRQISLSNYPDLNKLSDDFFQKYFDSYNLFDYIRLIKYFDNSLFKMIQDFVPARTNLASGVVIKQHLLERNKYPQPQVEWEDLDYSGSIYSQQIWDGATSSSYMSSSLIEKFEGSTGGVFNPYNNLAFTQSWVEEVKTPVGLLFISHSDQSEFYNGQLPYSDILVSNGELNEVNPFKYPSTSSIYTNTGSFEFNSYNPLIDNVEDERQSVIYMDVDYSQNPLIPVNQAAILNGTADKATVPDSNYSSYSWSNIRYKGSKYNSVKFN